jgi:hypothetical protein
VVMLPCTAACWLSAHAASADHVNVQVYEKHLPDAFAALLDLTSNVDEPVVYFYCLVRASHFCGDAFVAAQHVVLDSSVPYNIIEVSLPDMMQTHAAISSRTSQQTSQQSSANQSGGLPSRKSDETETTTAALNGCCMDAPSQAVSADDLMSMSIL